MIVDQPVSNATMALFHATQIAKMRSLNPQFNIDAALSQELPDAFQSRYFPPSGQLVGQYIGGNNSRKIIYLDGLLSIGQAISLVNGYASVFNLPHSPPLNSWIQEFLGTYLGRLSDGHFQLPEYLDVVGYSAGGAIATGICYTLRRQQTELKIKLVTFGAPRPGGPIVRDTLQRFPIARWMTPADPIPLIPPRIQDVNALALAYSPNQWVQFANTVHTQGGLQVDDTGTITPTALPLTAILNATSSIPNWLFSQEDDPNNQHAINRYIANLQASIPPAPQVDKPENPVAPKEDPEDDRRRGINQERDRVVTAIANQQHDQLRQPVVIPGPVLFTPVKLGRMWAVGFGDQVVANGIHEKTCRHICRAGNDFLRSLPKQALVDVDALQGQLSAFLALAQDPTSGITPTIKTTLNQG